MTKGQDAGEKVRASEADDGALRDDVSYSLLGVRAAVGGTLMGLANLVPGISGGTMLLASGVYPRFIAAIAELSTFRFRKRSVFVLGAVVAFALVSIVAFAGPVKDLVVDHRWVMYSLFIGLTLGGIPVVWKLARPGQPSLWVGAVAGFVPMAILAYFQMHGGEGASGNDGWMMMFVAGIAGASAMILPGVSGGYLLLVMGVYVTILGAVDASKEAVKAKDWSALSEPLMDVVVPVGLGVVVGILVVSNVLKLLLERAEKPTLGFLLGLLGGSVFGLWPFQEGVAPVVGDVFKGRVVTEETLAALSPDKYPTAFFAPEPLQMLAALGLVGVGFAATALVARLGSGKDAAKAPTRA